MLDQVSSQVLSASKLTVRGSLVRDQLLLVDGQLDRLATLNGVVPRSIGDISLCAASEIIPRSIGDTLSLRSKRGTDRHHAGLLIVRTIQLHKKKRPEEEA